MSVVVISTVTFVLGTMPELTDNLDIMLFDNETEVRRHMLQALSLLPCQNQDISYMCTCRVECFDLLHSRPPRISEKTTIFSFSEVQNEFEKV